MTDAHHDTVEQVHADIEACDRALHELVSAIVAHDQARALRRSPEEPFQASPFVWQRNLDRLAFEGMTKDPVRHALREGVKRVGREIYRLGGGTGAMLDSFVKVSELDPAYAGRRGCIMDSAFSGIGSGDERWCS